MERLTAREESGSAYYPHCFREDTCGGGGCAEHDGICEFSEKVCERLAAYEDTSLTPEQVIEMQEEMSEYKKLVGLFGKTVYNLVPMASSNSTYREDEVTRIEINETLTLIHFKNGLAKTINQIGKTLFITQEEAEQALKRLESET